MLRSRKSPARHALDTALARNSWQLGPRFGPRTKLESSKRVYQNLLPNKARRLRMTPSRRAAAVEAATDQPTLKLQRLLRRKQRRICLTVRHRSTKMEEAEASAEAAADQPGPPPRCSSEAAAAATVASLGSARSTTTGQKRQRMRRFLPCSASIIIYNHALAPSKRTEDLIRQTIFLTKMASIRIIKKPHIIFQRCASAIARFFLDLLF
jgi:hypothetical protein